MSTNIKSIRVILPATSERDELDVTEMFDQAGGVGATVGFDGVIADYFPPTKHFKKESWSLVDEPLPGPFSEGLLIEGWIAVAVAQRVLEYIEENDGPMTRLETFEPNGFAVVQVEDGGIDVGFVSYDDRTKVRFEELTNTLGLTLTVETLPEPAQPKNPKQPVRVEGSIIRADGTISRFSIGRDGYQQWGGSVAELGESVDLVGALGDAAREHFDFPEED